MRRFIKDNIHPLIIGFCIGITFMVLIKAIEDIIVKIALIYQP
jgi:hypothetical protein